MTVQFLLEAARAKLSRKAYKEAHADCLSVLKTDPHNAEAFYLLGILTADHANHSKAIELFDRSLANDEKHIGAMAQKARSLIALNQRDEALECANRAADAAPTDAYTLDTLGVVYSRAGRHDDAIPFYQKAVAKAPENANYHYNLAAALQFAGQLDEARTAYKQAVRLNPDDARSYAGIMTITKQTPEQNEIARLEALFPRFAADAVASLNIGHAIAKAYEDLGDGQKALGWLHKAKARKKQDLSYDPTFDRAIFAEARKLSDQSIGAPSAAPGPVFITGMPRTGTTLVDRILSSHSQVVSAGELTDFGLLLKRATKTPGPYVLDAATLAAGRQADLAQIGADYVQRVRDQLSIEAPIFIDKMPLNILYTPLLLQALPGARVICLRRHPADTVLSNYRQLFATGFSYYNYAYDLETTARYYVEFSRLVDHYSETLPDSRFTTVQYESVVADIETETRRLLDSCGLPFEQACIDFHTNAAPVATASSVQVRQPLYTSALARWKRYRPGIDPALNILVEAGCMSADELTD